MASSSIAGHGTVFAREGVPIAGILSISGPSPTRTIIDVTNLGSVAGYREFIAALKESGEVTLSMIFLVETFLIMKGDLDAGVPVTYSLVLPDESGTSLDFSGIVTSCPFGNVTPDEAITAEVTIKIIGAIGHPIPPPGPPEGEGEFTGTLISLTHFMAGLDESADYSSSGVYIDGPLWAEPVGSDPSYWKVPHPAGSPVLTNVWANVCMAVFTAPAARVSVASCGVETSLFHLCLRPDLYLEVRYSGANGSVRATSAGPLTLETWHNVSFVVHAAGSDPVAALYVDGVNGEIEGTPVTLTGIAVFVLGTENYVASYKVAFLSAALTSGGPLPLTGWTVSRLPVLVSTTAGYAVVAHSSSAPYCEDGPTNPAAILAILNQRFGWPAYYSNPPVRNASLTEDAGLALRAGGAGGGEITGSVAPMADSFPSWANVHVFGVCFAVTCCLETASSKDMTIAISNLPDGPDVEFGPWPIVEKFDSYGIRLVASCDATPGYWTVAELEDILFTFGAPSDGTHVFSVTAYVLHSGI